MVRRSRSRRRVPVVPNSPSTSSTKWGTCDRLRAPRLMDGRQRPARQGRADRADVPLGRLAERDLRDSPRRRALRHPDPAADRAGRPRRRHSAGVADHRGARRHRRAPHAGGRHVRRRVGARPDLLPDGFRRRLVADGRRAAAGRRRSTPTSTRAPGLAFQLVEGIALLAKVDWQAKGLAGPRPARRLPRAPGRPLDRVPRADQGPRAAGVRRRGRMAAGAPADRLRPRDHARRLPVRQRDVPPRRAGAARRDRRLGDGHGRRPEARPRLGGAGLARQHGRSGSGRASYVDHDRHAVA